MKYLKINSIEELKQNKTTEYFISFGIARSTKYITYFEDEKIFSIYNLIDDTEEELTEEELLKSNIGVAIEKNAFYAE